MRCSKQRFPRKCFFSRLFDQPRGTLLNHFNVLSAYDTHQPTHVRDSSFRLAFLTDEGATIHKHIFSKKSDGQEIFRRS